jgi:hypothetical protein
MDQVRASIKTYRFDLLVVVVTLSLYAFVVIYSKSITLLPEDWSLGLYGVALKDHLWEFLSYSPLKPPLFSFLHALVLHLAHLFDITERTAFIGFALTLNFMVAPLLYRAAYYMGAQKWLGAFFSILAALALIPLVRNPINYDLPVFFFLALFLFSVGKFLSKTTTASSILLSICTGLLVAQSTTQALFAPLSLLTIFLIVRRNENLFSRVLRAGLILTTPALVVIVLLLKNYAAIGFPINSSLAGHTSMLFSYYINSIDNPKKEDRWRRAAVEAGAPDWYLWCYDHTAHVGHRSNQVPWYRATGYCFTKLNFRPLKKHLVEMGATGQAEIVQQDIDNFENKEYLFTGVSTSMATRWFATYGQVSAKVSMYILKRDPVAWLTNAKYIHGNWYSKREFDYLSEVINGSRIYTGATSIFMDGVTVVSNWTRFWVYRAIPYLWVFLILMISSKLLLHYRVMPIKIPQRGSVSGAIIFTALLAGILTFVFKPGFNWYYYGFLYGIYMKPLYALLGCFLVVYWLSAVPHFSRFIRSIFSYLNLHSRHLGVLAYFLISITLTGVIYSSIVMGENQRFFFQLLPQLSIMAALILSALARLIRDIWHAACNYSR